MDIQVTVALLTRPASEQMLQFPGLCHQPRGTLGPSLTLSSRPSDTESEVVPPCPDYASGSPFVICHLSLVQAAPFGLSTYGQQPCPAPPAATQTRDSVWLPLPAKWLGLTPRTGHRTSQR